MLLINRFYLSINKLFDFFFQYINKCFYLNFTELHFTENLRENNSEESMSSTVVQTYLFMCMVCRTVNEIQRE